MFTKKSIIGVIIFLCLFIFMAIGVHYNIFYNLDIEAHKLISTIPISGFWKMVTTMASPIFILLALVIIVIVISNKKYGLLLFVNTIFIFLLNQGLKLIFLRERPFDLMITYEDGYSFPSGHTMMGIAFYGFIIYIIWQMNLSIKMKKIFTVLLIVLMILICLSRVYLGVHYLSDVLAGIFISLAYLIVFIKGVKKYVKSL